MHKCPVCDSNIEKTLCPDCGFDISLDYEHFKTLCPIPSLPHSIARLRQEQDSQDLVKCASCGSRRFRIEITSKLFSCAQCGKQIPVAQVWPKLTAAPKTTSIPETGCTVIAAGSNAWNRCNVSGWSHVKALAAGAWYTVGLRIDNTVLVSCDDKYGYCLSDLREVKAVAVLNSNILALCKNGTVWGTSLIRGQQSKVQKWVPTWNNIQAIAAGFFHTVGLRRDGTVTAVGSNFDGQCNVEQWSNVTAISCGNSHTVGLRKDGTVLAAGRHINGQCDVSGWREITAIAAGNTHTVGLRKDGTVVAVGNNMDGQCKVGDWTRIVAIAAGGNKTLGLRDDGTVISTDLKDPVQNWTHITAIAASESHVVGLQLPQKAI